MFPDSFTPEDIYIYIFGKGGVVQLKITNFLKFDIFAIFLIDI